MCFAHGQIIPHDCSGWLLCCWGPVNRVQSNTALSLREGHKEKQLGLEHRFVRPTQWWGPGLKPWAVRSVDQLANHIRELLIASI